MYFQIKIQEISDRTLDRGDWEKAMGERIVDMLADGHMDDDELTELGRKAVDMVEHGTEEQRDGLDLADYATTVKGVEYALRSGRLEPNRHIRDRERDLDHMREQRGLGREKAKKKPAVSGKLSGLGADVA